MPRFGEELAVLLYSPAGTAPYSPRLAVLPVLRTSVMNYITVDNTHAAFSHRTAIKTAA